MKTHDSFTVDGILYYPSDAFYRMVGYLTYTVDNPEKVENFLRAYFPIWLEQEQPKGFSTFWQDYYLPYEGFVIQYGDDYHYGYYRGNQYATAMGMFDAHFDNPMREFPSYDGDIPYFKGYVAGFEAVYTIAFEAQLYRNRFLMLQKEL